MKFVAFLFRHSVGMSVLIQQVNHQKHDLSSQGCVLKITSFIAEMDTESPKPNQPAKICHVKKNTQKKHYEVLSYDSSKSSYSECSFSSEEGRRFT